MAFKPVVQEIRDWTEFNGFAAVNVDLADGYFLELTFNKNKFGAPSLTEMKLTSSDSNTINTSFIQKLNLGEVIDLSLIEVNRLSIDSGDFAEAISFLTNKSNWKNAGNKPLPDINFAMTAWLYEYLKTNGTKNVILELAKLSKVKSVDTIKKRILEAKNRGLLIKGSTGNPNTYGGFVTKKGSTLILNYLSEPKEK